jgi:hypothetical protein
MNSDRGLWLSYLELLLIVAGFVVLAALVGALVGLAVNIYLLRWLLP